MWEVRDYGIGGLGIWISTAFYIGFPVIGDFYQLWAGPSLMAPPDNWCNIPITLAIPSGVLLNARRIR